MFWCSKSLLYSMPTLILKVRHKFPDINTFKYMTAPNLYHTVCMYLYNKKKFNVFDPCFVLYSHNFLNALLSLHNHVLFTFFVSCTIDQQFLLVPHCLPVCQVWEIKKHVSSIYSSTFRRAQNVMLGRAKNPSIIYSKLLCVHVTKVVFTF